MAFLGADTQQLMDHARALRSGDQRVDTLREVLQPTVAGVEWTGPDAEGFRDRWEQCSMQLLEVAAKLGSGAEHLAGEAAEQDAASDPQGQIAPGDYDGLIGGESWSDVINFFERLGDPFRDTVDTESMGGSYADQNPRWSPEDVGIDVEDIRLTDEQIENGQHGMQQGTLGDCWFLAALMAAQQTDPQQLADNITGRGEPPGSEGWDVDLFIDGEWQTTTVAPEEITMDGSREAAGDSWDDGMPGFMSVYERAMINAHDGRPSDVSADTPAAGIEMITGRSVDQTSLGPPPSFDEFREAIDANQPITVMTDPIAPMGDRSEELVAAHVYVVSDYDESTGEIILTNPHGRNSSNDLQVRMQPDDPSFPFDIFMAGIGE